MSRSPQFRQPSIDALQAAPVRFRYGSNRRSVLVDAFTASAILAVHAAANSENQAKLGRMLRNPVGLAKVSALAFKFARVA